ncbi:MAG: hypothetical protein HZC54_12425 [Verrucomicrobia bacterium]|nr:hypothetical protein [Verrucomicrobiota bacterium]
MPDLEYPKWGDKRLRWGMPGLRWDMPLPSWITHPPAITKGTKPMLTKLQAKLISLAEKIADGLQQLTGIITMAHNTEPGIRADIAAISDASNQADAAATALKEADTLLKAAIEAAYQFILKAGRVLRVVLGEKPSAEWAEAGWSIQSLKTPTEEDLLLPHLAKLKAFLEANPGRQVADPNINLTPANCAALHKALSDARSGDSDPAHANDPDRIRGVNWHDSNVQAKKATLVLTEKALQRRVQNFRAEFDDVVNDPMSPHYATVGLSRPGDSNAPAQVLNARLTALGSGQVRFQGDAVEGADHYIFRGKIVDVDAKPRYLGSNSNPDFIAEQLPVGKTVEGQIVAVNDENEQGPASDPATVVVT